MLNWIQEKRAIFNKTFPRISQNIQLTFIYFFALIDLMYAVLNQVYALGYVPELLIPFTPFIRFIYLTPIFAIWSSPEKIFLLSYAVTELMIIRGKFNFSKLIKYNILLIFASLMIQGVMISYWDVIFNREIVPSVGRWAADQGVIIFTDKPLAITFFMNTFYSFLLYYGYLYWQALQGKFATIYGAEWLTDSIAFWIKVKTPTMRVGRRKKRKPNSGKEPKKPFPINPEDDDLFD